MKARYCFVFSDVPPPWAGFAYFDTAEHLADVLFDHRGVPVEKVMEAADEGSPYVTVMCRVRLEDREAFLRVVDDLPDWMACLGYNDYADHCHGVLCGARRRLAERHSR